MEQAVELKGEFLQDDTMLSPKQEAFAQTFIAANNASYAYRAVYDCRGITSTRLWQMASALRRDPKVAARITALQREAASEAITTARRILQDWVDIADADPNELVRVEIKNCRHCNGTDYQYQFIDSEEWARDAAAQLQIGAAPRAMILGFSPMAEVRPECPKCFGRGVTDVIVCDSTKLSPRARKLYKGAKMNRYGEIEILMHDQQAARESIAKMLGAFKDGSEKGLSPAEPAKAIASDATPELAQRAYLTMVG
jgi:phage terminase small subunit